MEWTLLLLTPISVDNSLTVDRQSWPNKALTCCTASGVRAVLGHPGLFKSLVSVLPCSNFLCQVRTVFFEKQSSPKASWRLRQHWIGVWPDFHKNFRMVLCSTRDSFVVKAHIMQNQTTTLKQHKPQETISKIKNSLSDARQSPTNRDTDTFGSISRSH